ncbi:ABC transporter permease [Reinekea marinisedimentorum]|uniref:ABC-type lipoprotein release transport system permease subunit n=1 Tax=Reinekea marinisedimentorum TaxID=230495 RepID=A0A4R3I674_9GAMM|nr:FtsX-like permease family protein [Reinekea marinisedimentorum]TCS41409.1 ABC-type lipoprotein release transport system permease subunit [Reinekea marinisedimentorum]
MNLIFKLALRNIARNKRRTALTVLLISMTLALLIFSDGYMKAMSDVMIRSATRLYPGDAQIHQVGYRAEYDAELPVNSPDALLEKLQSHPLVQSYTVRTMDFGMVSSTANNLSVQVVGIRAESEAQVSKLKQSIVAGRYLSDDDAETQILIGTRLAEELEAKPGDRLVVSLNNYETQEIEQRLFRVTGIFKMNSKFFDEGLVFIQLPLAQQMLGLGSAIHEIAFNFQQETLSGDKSLAIWRELSIANNLAEGWKTLMPELASMIGMFDYSMFIVGGILFVVAILGVVNAMFMSIYERTYEFGVILAIGTRRLTIFKLIMTEGLMLCLVSLVIGAVIGTVAVLWVAHMGIDYGDMDFSGVALAEVLRPELRWQQFTELPFAVFLMTMLASVYPAIHAARIVPAKALHRSL